MPKTDGARVVADLKRLAEFGRYETGVRPSDLFRGRCRLAPLARREIRRGGAGAGDRRHRQRLRPRAGREPPAAGRLAQRDPAERRLARRRAGGDLRAGGGARVSRRPGAGGARHRCGRLGRRGRPLRQHARQPLVSPARSTRPRSTARRAATGSRCAMRWPRPGLPDARASRSSRAGTSAISKRISSRATRSTAAAGGSAWSKASSASGTTASCWTASRTTPARPRCRAAGMPGWRWCGWRRRSTTALPRSPARARCGRSGACCSTPTRRASSPAAPRCRCSSATPTRRSSPALPRRCRSCAPPATAPARAAAPSRACRRPSPGRWTASSRR